MNKTREKKEKYYKILQSDLTHFGFKYKEGLNIDTKKFDPNQPCDNGLHFCTSIDICMWMYLGSLIADVEIPPNEPVVKNLYKLKAHKIILKNIRPLRDFEGWRDVQYCLQIIDIDPHIFIRNYIQCKNETIYQRAVQNDGFLLGFIENQSPTVCMMAVQQNGFALKYVKKQTLELALEAVRQNGMALMFVEKQTENICVDAVTQDREAINFVESRFIDKCRRLIENSI